MARVANPVDPELTDLIDQIGSLTAWIRHYTTAHVRLLQSLASLICYSFHPTCYDKNQYDPIVLSDG